MTMHGFDHVPNLAGKPIADQVSMGIAFCHECGQPMVAILVKTDDVADVVVAISMRQITGVIDKLQEMAKQMAVAKIVMDAGGEILINHDGTITVNAVIGPIPDEEPGEGGFAPFSYN